jgi:hypothetical protein
VQLPGVETALEMPTPDGSVPLTATEVDVAARLKFRTRIEMRQIGLSE